ncbi:MAG TPA: hypothetical protein P5228_04975 [Bacteroidales bacterium]|nr:hypothetical protein [Bacteroidales bacterium]HRZ49873.1 hypothetical protein [Bacteroidales bacterium]
MKKYLPVIVMVAGFLIPALYSCKDDETHNPPVINMIADSGTISDGDTVAVGYPVRFRISATAADGNITNLTIKKVADGKTKTMLDSGMNSEGFDQTFTFYQGVEPEAEWVVSVMDRNRQQASISFTIYKDPLSTFGGIREWSAIRLGYQGNQTLGHFFLPDPDKIYLEDSAGMFQDKVDFLVYFNYRDDNGIMKPSPTFSSPGEEPSCTGELYAEYYPFLCNWTTRNYTKYDIRAVNGVTAEMYDAAHNDSLLIVSYDDVWGKKKYKWAMPGTFIPFQTATGKKGIIRVIEADTTETGSILFSMKMQL